ncbi:hypothetical protein Pcinc_036295 [Petrolisthes cinctipes]|uniref:Uncharacterized protein n=1 Tax=Petrolisthes cinctipes TaxID=88211 RepID=A0AAE1BWF5_PETCI|nr:hypothetical protein Pcinc_036295 [Petrolisthes cinctipes]
MGKRTSANFCQQLSAHILSSLLGNYSVLEKVVAYKQKGQRSSQSESQSEVILLACLAAVAAAAPQLDQAPPVAIIRDDRVDNGDGNFNYAFEADNGIAMEVAGTPGAGGQVNMQGAYRLTFPDGTVAEIRFIANENGFQPESDILPTPHPLPLHAQEQIRFAQEQRALGITFE